MQERLRAHVQRNIAQRTIALATRESAQVPDQVLGAPHQSDDAARAGNLTQGQSTLGRVDRRHDFIAGQPRNLLSGFDLSKH